MSKIHPGHGPPSVAFNLAISVHRLSLDDIGHLAASTANDTAFGI